MGEPGPTTTTTVIDGDGGGDPLHRSSIAVDDGISDFVTEEVDFDNFEDFDDDDSCLDGVEECMDIPGHEEDIDPSTTGFGTSYPCSHSRMDPVAPKSKLSLRQQKNSKLRVCEVEQAVSERKEIQGVRKPPVASVKPIQQQPTHGRLEQSSTIASLLTEEELYEEPLLVRGVPEVEGNSWKLHPFVKIKVDSQSDLLV